MPIAKAWRPLSWIGKELWHIQEKELYKERTYQFFSEYREHYLADLRKNCSPFDGSQLAPIEILEDANPFLPAGETRGRRTGDWPG